MKWKGSAVTALVLTQGHIASETILIWKFVMFESASSFVPVEYVMCKLVDECWRVGWLRYPVEILPLHVPQARQSWIP